MKSGMQGSRGISGSGGAMSNSGFAGVVQRRVTLIKRNPADEVYDGIRAIKDICAEAREALAAASAAGAPAIPRRKPKA